MAADIKAILKNLFEFYDFSGRTVISVGAGGGQFIEYGRTAKEVIAVDCDEEALSKLKVSITNSGLSDKFTLIRSDFYRVELNGDVVLFEFCLHEMENASSALNHAFTMAPEILVTDHWPTSEWACIVDETEKATKSWQAIEVLHPLKVKHYDSFQFFHDYEELFQKVKVQGQNSIDRIDKYKDMKDFTIPMTYGFALMKRGK